MNITTVNKSTMETERPEAMVSSQAIKNNAGQERLQRNQNQEGSSGKTLSMEESLEIADELNDIMASMGTNLGFQIREDLNNQVIVEIKNRKTDELIKQIPSEEMLAIMKKMEELSGLIFDQRV